ncbi:MAG: glycosyltransferase [Verrucomicrobiaceae bacterium]|nr:glycosyltransferase [Verrucomicrobiaceae bacterium]
MKILQLVQTLDPSTGGVASAVLATSEALAARGHATEVAALDEPSTPWVTGAGLPVHALGRGVKSYGYAQTLLPWLRQHGKNFDRVIVNGLWQYHSFAAWRAFSGTDTPYFVFPHGMLDPWFKRTYPLKHIKKLLYWPWAEYRVLRDAAAVLFTSEEERRLARESFALYRCREVVVNYGTTPPPPDLENARADFFSAFPELRERRLLLFLGRLHEKKGCDLLIEAFAALRNASGAARSLHLVMAGPAADEQYLARLKRLTATVTKDDGSITFPGMLTGRLKWGAFSAADAFVLPSHQENFGIAVAEALACGTPVLISNKVNIWREIETDGVGFVENDDLAGTTALLKRWVATSPDVWAAMREKAKESFARRFEIERATDSLLKVLHP